ncbi:hypothetical protein ACLTEW_24420 [Gordonia lacunae]|uniref:hypothetical protein n=1 Tax=Gordonia TaxID=2053 RepID=UPI00200B18BD|nr:hypothetical protein [Gordonia terrae]UPW12013.1 hypothetical protein M1C59_25515 [Gordonia terrae]
MNDNGLNDNGFYPFPTGGSTAPGDPAMLYGDHSSVERGVLVRRELKRSEPVGLDPWAWLGADGDGEGSAR